MSLSSLNSSSKSIDEILFNRTFVVAITSIWSFGVLLSTIALVVLFASKSKLIKSEFYILLSYNAYGTLYRVTAVVIFTLTLFFYPDIFNDCVFSIVNTLWSIVMFKLFMIMFYYSLFQVSSVSRHPLCARLHTLVLNVRTFLVFQTLVIVFITILLTYIVLVANAELHKCPSAFDLLSYMILFKFLTTYVLPSILPVLVYFIAICYVFFARLNNSRGHLVAANELKRARKDFKLLLRFLALGLVCTASSLLQNIFLYSMFFSPSFDFVLNSIVGGLGFFILAIQPILLIYIHSIMKQSSIRLFKRAFNNQK